MSTMMPVNFSLGTQSVHYFVLQDGRVLGFKKIMVLYKATGKKSKNVKTNWVMHQYHLGNHEEERDGELVACKVFFQKAPRSCPGRRSGPAPLEDEDCEPSESDIGFQEPLAAGVSGDSPSVSGVTKGMPPRTPKSYTPSHPAKQLYAEPTESISEISLAQSYVPQALATQSKQKVVLVSSCIYWVAVTRSLCLDYTILMWSVVSLSLLLFASLCST